MDDLLGKPEPLVDRLWRFLKEQEPLDTPEQRAGLRHRVMDHVGSIQDQHVREQYRSELMERFNALTRPQRNWQPNRPFVKGQRPFQAPRQASARTKAIGTGSLGNQMSRSVLYGLLRYPQIIGGHAEAIAALPLPDRRSARLRDALLDAAMAHADLDPERLNTILATAGEASPIEELRLEQGLAFSFTRRDADPERAQRDLVLVIDTLAARPGIDAALAAATARLKDKGEEAAFVEQQRLRAARDEADRRLATLIEGDAA